MNSGVVRENINIGASKSLPASSEILGLHAVKSENLTPLPVENPYAPLPSLSELLKYFLKKNV